MCPDSFAGPKSFRDFWETSRALATKLKGAGRFKKKYRWNKIELGSFATFRKKSDSKDKKFLSRFSEKKNVDAKAIIIPS